MPENSIGPKISESLAVPAGDFSEWLRDAEASLQSGTGATAVPCGVCTACCRSSMFIHINPEETQTIPRIPRALLFDAPGLPEGHLVMGYNDKGHCPILVDNKCSIYEYRPQTCRSYDCRVFAATGVAVDQDQPDIAHRVNAWVFNYESEESRQEHRTLKQAAAFLQKNGHLFPPGTLPTRPAQIAALAVMIYRIFSTNTNDAAKPDAEIARDILIALNEPETFSK
jgi:Fe-S-cluster containining protein